MKSIISKYAALIRVNDEAFNFISDDVFEMSDEVVARFNEELLLTDICKYADSHRNMKYIKNILQILTNINQRDEEIQELNYKSGAILFTIDISDDYENNMRHIVNDIKTFRKYKKLKEYVIKEFSDEFESLCI